MSTAAIMSTGKILERLASGTLANLQIEKSLGSGGPIEDMFVKPVARLERRMRAEGARIEDNKISFNDLTTLSTDNEILLNRLAEAQKQQQNSRNPGTTAPIPVERFTQDYQLLKQEIENLKSTQQALSAQYDKVFRNYREKISELVISQRKTPLLIERAFKEVEKELAALVKQAAVPIAQTQHLASNSHRLHQIMFDAIPASVDKKDLPERRDISTRRLGG